MIDDFTTDEEQSTIFESFSDFALCTLAVALLLVTLLAITITQNLNVTVNRNTFSGGVTRPTLNLECTVPDFSATTTRGFAAERALFPKGSYVAVHLFGPSMASISTDVQAGGTIALGEDQTFSQQQDLSLNQFMQLAPGIEPGSFKANGRETALLIPKILSKEMVYEPQLENGYRAPADRRLTGELLTRIWPVYAEPIYKVRRAEDYRHARTRVFVETQTFKTATGEEHYVVIGHSAYKLPDAMDDGSLAWLNAFSSGLTELVFLGETWSRPEECTNKRIAFFERAGFGDCAAAYREYAFPTGQTSAAVDGAESTLLKLGYSGAQASRRARNAVVQRQASEALLAGVFAANEGGFFPPLMAYPDAWAAYIADCEEEKPDPPKWFYSEFLDRLGFDRLTIEAINP